MTTTTSAARVSIRRDQVTQLWTIRHGRAVIGHCTSHTQAVLTLDALAYAAEVLERFER